MWIDEQLLRNSDRSIYTNCWIPEDVFIVVGSSNKIALEINEGMCETDNIPIYRRKGGGGAVVLYPGCVCVGCGVWVANYYDNSRYFYLLNQAIIDSLVSLSPNFLGITQDGISDITWEGEKIGGTSMFRRRNYLLYQASLLVDVNDDLISRYLKHPSSEPAYRNSRKHEDFLIGLNEIEKGLTVKKVKDSIIRSFEERLMVLLVDDILSIKDHTAIDMLR